MPAKNNLIL